MAVCQVNKETVKASLIKDALARLKKIYPKFRGGENSPQSYSSTEKNMAETYLNFLPTEMVSSVVETVSNISQNIADRLGISKQEYERRVNQVYVDREITEAELMVQSKLHSVINGMGEFTTEILHQPNDQQKNLRTKNPRIKKFNLPDTPEGNWLARYLMAGKDNKDLLNLDTVEEVMQALEERFNKYEHTILETDDTVVAEVTPETIQGLINGLHPQIDRAEIEMLERADPNELKVAKQKEQRANQFDIWKTLKDNKNLSLPFKLMIMESTLDRHYEYDAEKDKAKSYKIDSKSMKVPPLLSPIILNEVHKQGQVSSTRPMLDYFYFKDNQKMTPIDLVKYEQNKFKETDKGTWYKFEEGSDPKHFALMSGLTAGTKAEWCTGHLSSAEHYLQSGDVYIFFDKGQNTATLQLYLGKYKDEVGGLGYRQSVLDRDNQNLLDFLESPEMEANKEKAKSIVNYTNYKKAISKAGYVGYENLDYQDSKDILDGEQYYKDTSDELEKAKAQIKKEHLAKYFGIVEEDFSKVITGDEWQTRFEAGEDTSDLVVVGDVKLDAGQLENLERPIAEVVIGRLQIEGGNPHEEGKDFLKVDKLIKEKIIGDVVLTVFGVNFNTKIVDTVEGNVLVGTNRGGSRKLREKGNITGKLFDKVTGKVMVGVNKIESKIFDEVGEGVVIRADKIDTQVFDKSGDYVSISTGDISTKLFNTSDGNVNIRVYSSEVSTKLFDTARGDLILDVVEEVDGKIFDEIGGSFDSIELRKVRGKIFNKVGGNLQLHGLQQYEGKMFEEVGWDVVLPELTETHGLIGDRIGEMLDVKNIQNINHQLIREVGGDIYMENVLEVKSKIADKAYGEVILSNLKTIETKLFDEVLGEIVLTNLTEAHGKIADKLFSNLILPNLTTSTTKLFDNIRGNFIANNLENVTNKIADKVEGRVGLETLKKANTKLFDTVEGIMQLNSLENYTTKIVDKVGRLGVGNIEEVNTKIADEIGGLFLPSSPKINSLLADKVIPTGFTDPSILIENLVELNHPLFKEVQGAKIVLPNLEKIGTKLADKIQNSKIILKEGVSTEEILPPSNNKVEDETNNSEKVPNYYKEYVEKEYGNKQKYYTINSEGNDTFFQGSKGAIIKFNTGERLTVFGKDSDITTIFHEKAHEYEDALTKEEISTVEKWSGHKHGTVEFSEAFAKGAERFIYEGNLANNRSPIGRIFEKFKNWFRDAITSAIEYFGDISELNPEIKNIYAKMLLENRELANYDFTESQDNIRPNQLSYDATDQVQVEKAVEEVNKVYSHPMVGLSDGNKVTINPPNEVINDYLPKTTLSEEQRNLIESIQSQYGQNVIKANSDGTFTINKDKVKEVKPEGKRVPVEANEEATSWAKKFLESVGVSLEKVSSIVVGGRKLNAEAVALPLRSLVLYTQDNAMQLTEEAMHIAVELLSQKGRKEYNRLMKNIERTELYQEVYEQYKDDPLYQNRDGSVNITKMKKEAVAKALTDKVVLGKDTYYKKADTWWGKIKEFLSNLFQDSGKTVLDSYRALELIMGDKLGNVRTTLLQNPRYLRSIGVRKENINTVIEYASDPSLSNQEVHTLVSTMLPEISFQRKPSDAMQSAMNIIERAVENNGFNLAESKFVTKALRGGDKALTRIRDKVLGRQTTDGGIAVREALSKFLRDDGTLKDESEISFDNVFETKLYDKLKRLALSYDSNTVFKVDYKITSPVSGDSSTVDLMVFSEENQVHMYNFLDVVGTPSVMERTVARTLIDEQVRIVQDINKNFNLGERRVLPIDIADKVNPNMATKDSFVGAEHLFPVFSKTEHMENKYEANIEASFKNLVEKLSHKTYGDKQAEKEKKKALGAIAKTLRDFQFLGEVEGVLNRGFSFIKKNNELAEKIEATTKGRRYSEYKNELGDLLDNYQLNIDILNEFESVLGQVREYYDELIRGLPEEGDTSIIEDTLKSAKEELQRATALRNQLLNSKENIDKITMPLLEEHIASTTGVTNIRAVEKVPSYLARKFKPLSQQTPKTLQALYQLVKNVWHQTDLKTAKKLEDFKKKKKNFEAYMRETGKSYKEALKLLMKEDTHELIDRYKNEFYRDVDKAVKEGDVAWIKENIDVEAYNREYEAIKKERITDIEASVYHDDPLIDRAKKDEAIEKFEKRYNLDLMEKESNNDLVRKFPLPKWETSEYKTLSNPANKAVKDVYDEMMTINKRLYESGVIQEYQMHTFVPFVKRSLMESISFGSIRLLEQTIGSAVIRPDDDTLGSKDSKGEPKMHIPVYYTEDFSVIDRDGSRDHSIMSRDIFHLMYLMEYQINRYEASSEMETVADLLYYTEKNKLSLATDSYGNRNPDAPDMPDDIKPQMIKDFMAMEIYRHKYIDKGGNLKLFEYSNKHAKRINRFFGRKILTEEYDRQHFTAREIAESLKKFQTLKVLGLNIPVSMASITNNLLHAHTNLGNYIGRKDLSKANRIVFGGQFLNDDAKKSFLLAQWFMPRMESGDNEHAARFLKMNKLDSYTMSELMMLNHKIGDYPVQMSLAISHLMNTTIVDGQLVNINKMVRDDPKYSRRNDLTLSTAERDRLRQEMQQEIQDLKDTQSLVKLAKVDSEGQVYLEGIDRYSDVVHELRERIQQDSREASGMGNSQDVRLYQGQFWLNQIMTFMSWAPRTINSRLRGLEYDSGQEDFEWGRWRVMMNLLTRSGLRSIQEAKNIWTLNEKGIESLMEEYEVQKAKFEFENPGHEFTLTENDFIELYQRKVKATMKAVLMQLAIAGTAVGVMAFVKAGVDEERRGYWRYVNKIMQKSYNEVNFYYNPKQWISVTERSFLPALGALTDAGKVLNHVAQGGFNLALDNSDKATEQFYKAGKMAIKNVPMNRGITPIMTLFMTEEMQKKTGFTPKSELDPFGM